MTEYMGISRSKYPNWGGWNYISLYSSITNDFDNDKPLQKLVKKHYLKQSFFKLLFNVGIYAFIYSIICLIK